MSVCRKISREPLRADGIRKRCSEPSMPLSRRRVEDEKGGYLSIGQVEIVRYKPNAEAVFGASAAENKNRWTWPPSRGDAI